MVRNLAPRGHPLPVSEGVEVCMGQTFKLLAEGWCHEQSSSVGQGHKKYDKILSEGPVTTELQGVKVRMGRNFKLLLEGWCPQQSCSR